MGEASNGLVSLSFDSPAPGKRTYSWDRERNLDVIHQYVIGGELLETEAVSDMLTNPEALSCQMEALEGWVAAAEAGEKGVRVGKHADKRLKFIKTILDWAIEMGNGSIDFIPDRTAGNGSDGLPVCTSTHLEVQEGRRRLAGADGVY